MTRGRLNYSLSLIGDETLTAVATGHEISLAIRMPEIVDERISVVVTVAVVRETYEGWGAEDYQRARLRLHRATRDRLRELVIQNQREAD